MPAGRRKKLPEEYSTNPNTIRARKRKARLSPFSKEVEQAKASDAKALTRAWKQRFNTETYKMASEEERKSILASCEEEVMNRRRHKGLDADSKISRFIGRMENEKLGSRPARSTASSGTSTAPIGPVDPALSSMQPVAAMGPPLSQVSRGYGAPYNPYSHQNVLPSIEDRIYTESPFPYQGHMFSTPPKHGHYHQPVHPASFNQHSHFNHMHPHVHDDEAKYQPPSNSTTPDAFRKAQVPRDFDEAVQNITILEKRIKALEADLAVAKTTIAAQGECMNKLDSRMQKYDTTVEGVNHAEHNFKTQASLLERVVQGVQKIADVAAEVALIMRSDHLDARPRPQGNGSGDEDGDSGIGPDATMV